MESEFFLDAGIPEPPLQFEASTISSMPTWHTISSVMEMQANELHCATARSPDGFFNPTWDKSKDHSLRRDSALSSMVSSPAVSSSNMSNDSFVIRELIGKLGSIGGNINSNNNSGGNEISPYSQPMLAASFVTTNASNSTTNICCYTTPSNSPPKLNVSHVMDQVSKEQLNFPSLGKPLSLSAVAEFTADPGFAERAARFSCFGSRSFNDRTGMVGATHAELANRSSSLMENGKLPRISSSHSLKAIRSQKGNMTPLQDRSELVSSSQEESSASEHIPNAKSGFKASNESNSRKRKAALKGKAKESASTPPANAIKDAETDETWGGKRFKQVQAVNGNEKSPENAEEMSKASEDEKQAKSSPKPPEPPKDYIHVRARRGQATDSHSLAERVRREKISERMKLLQDLVPGCNKVTGKAVMLDEIINYVQSLQRQVEFLSMKLASVNTRLDFSMDSLVSKDIFQSNKQPLAHPTFPLDSSASAIFGLHQQSPPQLPSNISNGALTHFPVDPSHTRLGQNLNMQIPQLDGFNQSVPQYSAFCEDDLQTLVQMGFGQNPNLKAALQSRSPHGSNQTSHLKMEL